MQLGTEFLRNEGVLNERCVPNDAALYLTLALWADVPKNGGDASGNARSLIRKAFWRGCFTDRYGKTSATRAYADYRILKKFVTGNTGGKCELFEHDLPDVYEFSDAGWPGRKDRLARAILAVSLRRGAMDFADGSQISREDFGNRELHHLYPYGYMECDRGDEYVNCALNCALISWSTNRRVGAKSPSVYIGERAEAAALGKKVVKQRLQSQLIPYDALVADDYERFLEERAILIHEDMITLCNGAIPE
jgi:hypothetical protein